MEIVGAVFGLLVVWYFVPKVIANYRYNTLLKKYVTKWDLLSLQQKEDFHFARLGLALREIQDKMTSASRSGKHYYVDTLMDNFENACKEKDYSQLSALELTKEFYEFLDKYWKSMKMLGDYDFNWLTGELEILFADKDGLAEYGRKMRIKDKKETKSTI